MINIIICILSLALGLIVCHYEIKKTNNTLEYYFVWAFARFFLFFMFGYFLTESVKWIVGIKTLIF